MTLDEVRRIAMSLPEATEQPHFELTSFRVRGKIFATIPPDGEYVHVFVDEEDRERATAIDPETFEKLWWGSKVVGVRAALARVKRPEVTDLLYRAWRRKAPKRLAASFSPGDERP